MNIYKYVFNCFNDKHHQKCFGTTARTDEEMKQLEPHSTASYQKV